MGNDDSINGNEAKGTELVKQYDGLIVVKDLSAETIDDKVTAEEQVNLEGPANHTFSMRRYGRMFNGCASKQIC